MPTKSPVTEYVRDRIIEVMERKGLTKEDVFERSEITVESLSTVLSAREITADDLVALADVLKVEVGEFFPCAYGKSSSMKQLIDGFLIRRFGAEAYDAVLDHRKHRGVDDGK